MEKGCYTCAHVRKHRGEYPCFECCGRKDNYPKWTPPEGCFKNERKKILDILHDVAKNKFNLEIFEKYDPTKPEYLTVNFVKARDWKHRVVTTMVFDLTVAKMDRETLGRIEEQIREDLADLNGGYYLKNMDWNSLYPTGMVKLNVEDYRTKDTIKRWLNYQYGKKLFNDEPRIKKLSFEHSDGLRTSIPIIDEVHEYCRNDVKATKELYEMHVKGRFIMMTKPEIKKVHFNDPVTVVIWKDGTKTIVRAQNGDEFDPEKGLAMAISKKVLGNKGNYFDEFKKWLPEEKKEEPVTINIDGEALKNAVEKATEAINKVSTALRRE